MRKTLLQDCDLLLELLATRQDNCFLLRLNCLLAVQRHRGLKECSLKTLIEHKQIIECISEIESKRKELESQLLSRYQNSAMDGPSKVILFAFVNKAIRLSKVYLAKVQAHFPRFAEYLNQDCFSFLSQFKELSVRHCTHGCVNKFIQFVMDEWTQRLKKEISRLLGFYNSFGGLIDKRGERQQVNYFSNKNEKYICSLGISGAQQILSLYRLHFRKGLKFLYKHSDNEVKNPYDILKIEDRSVPTNVLSDRSFNSSLFGPKLDQGMVDMLTNRFERMFRELLAGNREMLQQVNNYLIKMRKGRRRAISNKSQHRQIRERSKCTSQFQICELRIRNINSSKRWIKQGDQLEAKEYKAPIPYPLESGKENERKYVFGRLSVRGVSKSMYKKDQ